MTDMLGKEVHIGDQVVFTMPIYANLCVGTVYKITPRGISCKRCDICWRDEKDELVPVPAGIWGSGEFFSRTKEQFAIVDK